MTEWSARIHGRVVSKKNSRIIDPRSGRTFPSKAYTAFKQRVTGQLARCLPVVPFTGPLELVIMLTLPNRQSEPDLDNSVSSILDVMQDLGVFVNDRQVVRIVAEKQYGAASFGADITVSTVAWEQEAA